jgi:hypothetical protein
MIWIGDTDQAGKRVTVYAESLAEAKRLLELEHGNGNVFDLHNPEEADKPR